MPLKGKFKEELEKRIASDPDEQCWRCSLFHRIRVCPKPFEQCWMRGPGNVGEATRGDGTPQDREEAEAVYKKKLAEVKEKGEAAKKKEIEDKMAKKPQAQKPKTSRTVPQPSSNQRSLFQQPQNNRDPVSYHGVKNLRTPAVGPSSQPTSGIKTAGAPNLPHRGPSSTNKSHSNVVASTSSTKVASGESSAKDRKPIPDDNLGQFEYKHLSIAQNPYVPSAKSGVYRTVTAHISSTGNANGKSRIMSNYVQVKGVPKQLYIYSLRFWRPAKEAGNPPQSFNKRREIQGAFQAMLGSGVLGITAIDKNWATDFKDLWCSVKLPKHAGGEQTWDTEPFPYTQLNGKPIDDIRATVSFTRVLDDIDRAIKEDHITDLSDYVRALNAHVARSALDHSVGGRLTQIGANKFFVNNDYADMGGLYAVRGYYNSIRPAEGGPLLNVNTATSAFLPPWTVSALLDKVQDQNYVEKMLKGALVRIAYRRRNFEGSDLDVNSEEARRKVFRHFGVSARKQMFFKVVEKDKKDANSTRYVDPTDAGRTVIEYLENDALVQNLAGMSGNELLCVNVGKGISVGKAVNSSQMQQQSLEGAIWVPACLLEILPYQTTKTQLNSDHTTEMIKHAVRLPAPNAEMIDNEGLRLLGVKVPTTQNAGNDLKPMGFTIDQKLISLDAKTLTIPPVWYGPKRDPKTGEATSKDMVRTPIDANMASWNLQNVSFVNPNDIRELHVLGLTTCFANWQIGPGTYKVKDDKAKELLGAIKEDMTSKLRQHNVKARAGYHEMQLHTRSVDAELKDWFDACEHNDCTLVLLRSKDYDTYSTIKRMADLDRGMHTLCAVGKKIDPNRDEQKRHQFLANLTLKVNIKIAGDNHYPDQTTLNKLLGNRRNSTIIFGADVAHPGAGAKLGSPSIACVVGSVDEVFMKYPGSMRLQAGGQEQIEPEHLRSMLKERFQAWSAFENKNRLPTSVLFYRDGVSESQFKMCQEDEIPEIEAAYKELGGDTTKLTITFVVVGKRHHTRFYPTNTSQSYEERKKIGNASRMVTNGNLKPGLLVDSVVTNPEPSNFFLQSHCAIQGTARSAHYHILHDGMALGKTILPQLTLLLCCAFSRSTKVVSYVAPAYIADRLCERGRVYLRPWTINSSRGPTWPAPKDTAGKPFTKDRFDSWKKGKAQELANTPGIWGPNYNENPNHPTKSVRLNPWHPNLDQGMFWM